VGADQVIARHQQVRAALGRGVAGRCKVQAGQHRTGSARLRGIAERCPGGAVAVQIMAVTLRVQFVGPVAMGDRGGAIAGLQHLHNRESGSGQVRDETVLFDQHVGRAHAAMVAFDEAAP